MKCQRCPKQVAYHITEVLGEGRVEDLHLCEDCAKAFLSGQIAIKTAKSAPAAEPEVADPIAKTCPECHVKFVEFRNSGRLGCPHDYEAFREELVPLLESIHGDTRHCGKAPRTHTQPKAAQKELTTLRRQLQDAVNKEKYEDAARIRDTIKTLEGG